MIDPVRVLFEHKQAVERRHKREGERRLALAGRPRQSRDKGRSRKELPKYVRQGPAIGSDEAAEKARQQAGFTPGTLQWSRLYARKELDD